MKNQHIIIGFIAIFFLWAASALLIYRIIPEPSNRGLFGDMFGAVNALFSGLALFGLLYTIYLQHLELKNSKYDLKFNRLIDILDSQAGFFNTMLNDYTFQKVNIQQESFLKINEVFPYYDVVKNNLKDKNQFIKINSSVIIEATTYLSDTINFVRSLIKKENLIASDQLMLERLFSRNIHHKTLDLLELSIELVNYLQKTATDLYDDELKNMQKKLADINIKRLNDIILFLNYKVD